MFFNIVLSSSHACLCAVADGCFRNHVLAQVVGFQDFNRNTI